MPVVPDGFVASCLIDALTWLLCALAVRSVAGLIGPSSDREEC